jgi:hypothetical protein
MIQKIKEDSVWMTPQPVKFQKDNLGLTQVLPEKKPIMLLKNH